MKKSFTVNLTLDEIESINSLRTQFECSQGALVSLAISVLGLLVTAYRWRFISLFAPLTPVALTAWVCALLDESSFDERGEEIIR